MATSGWPLTGPFQSPCMVVLSKGERSSCFWEKKTQCVLLGWLAWNYIFTILYLYFFDIFSDLQPALLMGQACFGDPIRMPWVYFGQLPTSDWWCLPRSAIQEDWNPSPMSSSWASHILQCNIMQSSTSRTFLHVQFRLSQQASAFAEHEHQRDLCVSPLGRIGSCLNSARRLENGLDLLLRHRFIGARTMQVKHLSQRSTKNMKEHLYCGWAS